MTEKTVLINMILIFYPLVILWIGIRLIHRCKNQSTILKMENDFIKTVGIIIVHSLLLMIAISSFMVMNYAGSISHYVIDSRMTIGAERIEYTFMQLIFFVAMVTIIGLGGIAGYVQYSIKYIGVLVHSIGLIITLLGYMSILRIPQNGINYANMIIKCEGIYFEGLILTIIFIMYTNLVKE